MAKKIEKIPQSSMDVKPLSKPMSWNDYLNNRAYMQFPEKDDWRKRFTCTMLEWASQEDSLEITDFAIEMKMHRQTLYSWADKYPDIKEALDITRLILGSRRRKGALTRKYDKDMALRDMHCYDPEWLAINKYHSDMKVEQEKQAHTFIISDAKPKVVSKEEMIEAVEGKE